MIGYIKGTILDFGDHQLILETGGIGYEIWIGNQGRDKLGSTGDDLALWIHTHVREDQFILFGFPERIQKTIFLILNGVTGIGPKLAMAIVGQIPARDLADAVMTGDTKLLCTVPGVGKKMASRLILELKDKLANAVTSHQWESAAAPKAGPGWGDLHEALAGLGFADSRIRAVILLAREAFAGKPVEINELLKFALQKIRSC